MRILFIEPYYGGSHGQFADAVARYSAHDVRLLTLPASFWKWRMRGAHLTLRHKVNELAGSFDVLLASDMLSLAELKGVAPGLAAVPSVVYFHENQLCYPVPKGESPDVHFGFTNLSTALAADRLVFNSRFHRDSFLGGIADFLRPMPDHPPRRLPDLLRTKCRVVYPGVDCAFLDSHRTRRDRTGPPAILWNHRWEGDKQPEVFFGALERLASEGHKFSLNVVGENFQVRPTPFEKARETLGSRMGAFGFVEDRGAYASLLWRSDLVVSTALQEFFGIAVMEAAWCGCYPLVPRRLAYPELYADEHLYKDDEDLVDRLRSLFSGGIPAGPWHDSLRRRIRRRFDAASSVAALDEIMEEVRGER